MQAQLVLKLTTAEREELGRLRRRLRQVEQGVSNVPRHDRWAAGKRSNVMPTAAPHCGQNWVRKMRP